MKSQKLTPLKIGLVGLLLTTGLTSFAQTSASGKAAPTGTTTPKSTINTNIYEKQDYSMGFTDTVAVIRDMEDTTQVKFVKMAGFFGAPTDGASMAALVESKKHQTPVTIKADDETRKILKATLIQKNDP